jgi:pimeloyl-ACP methyl ester carboxylesterase
LALYARLLSSLPADASLDLNFRIDKRHIDSTRVRETGAYRLRVGKAGTGFGRFEVERDRLTGKFLSDRSLAGDRDDFERMPGALLFDAESEDLDPAFYGRLAGRYRLASGCELVVTHSVVRVLVRNTCDQSWRGLERVNGTRYTIGRSVLPTSATSEISFDLPNQGAATSLTLTTGLEILAAARIETGAREEVTFRSSDGTTIAGTLSRPVHPPQAATILVHGSGPQDRNGYASIIAVLADELTASGHAVLAYDKRGSGASDGDGARASFDVLASDAEAARRYLLQRTDLARLPSGFAGSSQAGWVVARAIAMGSDPQYVLLLGAAGSAMTVRTQNAFNTRARMACAGFSESDITLALEQQDAFFDHLAGARSAAYLDAITLKARRRPQLNDWRFPSSSEIDRNSDDWFNVLDVDFDPRPIWQGYRGHVHLIFARHDDSTPTELAVREWRLINPRRNAPTSLAILARSQHIGLKVSSVCQSDFAKIDAFDPEFFLALQRAARAINALRAPD